MSPETCDICEEPTALHKCDKCSKWTCEERGHTVTKHTGSVNCRDSWECSECEFGPSVIVSDLEEV